MNNEKKEFKDAIKELRGDFKTAVKDKKRWLVCAIELLLAGAVILIDFITKILIYNHCDEKGDIILIPKVLRFTAVENTGASFGIFQNQTAALTIVSAICAILLVIFIFYSYPRRNKLLRASLIMITGGAIGNLIDRIALGFVRDFVYFELIDFAVFNFADSFLTVGTALLIIYVLFFFGKEEEEKHKKKLKESAQNAEQPTETAERESTDTQASPDKE